MKPLNPRSALLIVALAAAGLALPSHAQTTNTTPPAQPPPPGQAPAEGTPKEHAPHDRLDHLAKALDLTDDQKAKIGAILKEEMGDLKDLKEQDLPKDEFHEQAKAIQEKYRPQIEAVLTADQKAKFAEMEAHHHAPPAPPATDGTTPPPAPTPAKS